MKKKIVAILLSAFTAFSLIACGGADTAAPADQAAAPAAEPAPAPAAEEAAPAAGKQLLQLKKQLPRASAAA